MSCTFCCSVPPCLSAPKRQDRWSSALRKDEVVRSLLSVQSATRLRYVRRHYCSTCVSPRQRQRSILPATNLNRIPKRRAGFRLFRPFRCSQEGSGEPKVNALADERTSLEDCKPEFEPPSEKQRVGSDFPTLWRRFRNVAAPYWSSEDKTQARWRLAGVLALTLGTTGISVGFNFIGRDFYNALASKDQEQFLKQLTYYLGAFVGGIPVFVIRDYSRDRLALRWRAWMTKYYMDNYFKNQTFYDVQSQSLVDNPDQRIVDDVNSFTSTALLFALALFTSTIDLISFSGILYGIYPPLFTVLVVYSIGGTALSVALGKGLVGLNFMQEKREADFRYGLVRVRENAESIAFYGGEGSEIQLLLERFKQSYANYSQLLISSRNLDFFTSAYRYLIQLLPAAVVAPLYFAGQIEFGVINQSFSAFNHILSDFSIIVYQFQSISSFSAVVDRLGEFSDILDQQNAPYLSVPTPESRSGETLAKTSPDRPRILMLNISDSSASSNGRPEVGSTSDSPLLEVERLTLQTPQYTSTLVEELSFSVHREEHLLIMGVSGSGKTSLLRAIAGLWTAGEGTIKRHFSSEVDGEGGDESNGAAATRRVFEEYNKSGGVVSSNGFELTSPELRVPPSDQVKLKRSTQAGAVKSIGPVLQEDPAEISWTERALEASRQIFFLPQRPYMVLGSLRQQILYPTWTEQYVSIRENSDAEVSRKDAAPFVFDAPVSVVSSDQRPQPSDDELIEVLERVSLGHLMDGCDGLDASIEWSSVLSLGEQQRLAFARLLVSKPALALLDESSSALDEENEVRLYNEVEKAGITYVSVGHRSTLRRFHKTLLTIGLSKAKQSGRNWTFEPLVSQADRETLGSAF